jgi:hypothetical protein
MGTVVAKVLYIQTNWWALLNEMVVISLLK